MDRHPSGDPGPVRHGAAAGEPLDEERLPALQHGQVHVLVQHLLDVLHKGHGRLAEGKGGGIPVDQLPQAQAQPDGPAAAHFQEPMPGKLPDQPVGGAQRQPGPVRELGEGQHGDALGER